MESLSNRILAAVVIPQRGEPRIQVVRTPHEPDDAEDDAAADSDPSPEAFAIATPMRKPGAGGAASDAGGLAGSHLSPTESLLREMLKEANATISELREQLGAAHAELKYAVNDAELETLRAVLAKDKAKAKLPRGSRLGDQGARRAAAQVGPAGAQNPSTSTWSGLSA